MITFYTLFIIIGVTTFLLLKEVGIEAFDTMHEAAQKAVELAAK